MDGIPSGLSSVTPILPQTLLVGDRGGLNLPPVEVMPLPDDSFNADGTSAEMRANNYAPNLDARGAWSGGDVRDVRTVGKAAASTAGRISPEVAAAGTQLDAAYTLSLGDSGDVPVPPEIAREFTRVRNYELLGRTPARQVYRRNPDTGAVEQNTADWTADKPPAPFGNVRGDRQPLLAMSKDGVNVGAFITDALQVTAGEADITRLTPKADETRPPVRSGGLKLADRLTPSDYEAILSLEPDLREALLGMLADENIALTLFGQDASPAAPKVPESGYAFVPRDAGALGLPAEDAGDTDAASFKNLLTALLGKQETLLSTSLGNDAASMAQITELAHGATTASGLTPRLAAALLAAAAPDTRAAVEAGMAHLQKITELPYALYLFGNVTPEKHPVDEEDDTRVIHRERSRPGQTSEFLRLSEAVKMASVLHHIYHGGDGYFPAGVPWYAPYVSYAVKHGIIRGDEFSDFSNYATRAETAYIFSGCVPKAAFPVLNYAPRLVDVDEDAGYGPHVYLLCRAGVLTGGDKDGRFFPESTFTRSEAAAIIGRIATPGDRKRF